MFGKHLIKDVKSCECNPGTLIVHGGKLPRWAVKAIDR